MQISSKLPGVNNPGTPRLNLPGVQSKAAENKSRVDVFTPSRLSKPTKAEAAQKAAHERKVQQLFEFKIEPQGDLEDVYKPLLSGKPCKVAVLNKKNIYAPQGADPESYTWYDTTYHVGWVASKFMRVSFDMNIPTFSSCTKEQLDAAYDTFTLSTADMPTDFTADFLNEPAAGEDTTDYAAHVGRFTTKMLEELLKSMQTFADKSDTKMSETKKGADLKGADLNGDEETH